MNDQHHEHGFPDHAFETWSYESERPFSSEALREMVRKELPASIYRCKGIIFSADSPGARLALQMVGRRAEITELDPWREREPRSSIVAIGALDGVDSDELTTQFEACLTETNKGH